MHVAGLTMHKGRESVCHGDPGSGGGGQLCVLQCGGHKGDTEG